MRKIQFGTLVAWGAWGPLVKGVVPQGPLLGPFPEKKSREKYFVLPLLANTSKANSRKKGLHNHNLECIDVGEWGVEGMFVLRYNNIFCLTH